MKKLWILALALMVFCVPCLAESSAAIANPWVETTAEGVMETLGLSLNVPEGATDVSWRMLEADSLAEMHFILNGMSYTARVKPAEAFEDISGMYYEWENPQEDDFVGACPAWEARAKDGDGNVDLVLWYDVAPGLMYSLDVYSLDPLDGFDLIAVADQVYLPAQQDA